MDFTKMWAKKPFGGTAPTVDEHCRDVQLAADTILNAIGHDLAIGLGTEPQKLVAEFRPLLRAAALLHDFAKVNSAFQAMLVAPPGSTTRQPVRHEILAAWLLTDPKFYGTWTSKVWSDEERWPVVWAVAGHHLKMSDPSNGKPLFNRGSGTRKVILPLRTAKTAKLLSEALKDFRPEGNPDDLADIEFDTVDDDDHSLEWRISEWVRQSCRAWKSLHNNEIVIRRVAVLKALLMSADGSASALTENGEAPPTWIPPALGKRIVGTDLGPVIVEGLGGKDARTFQTNVGASTALATVVVAGCGNGKTTAAYLWAQKHAHGRKLFFTYPTTGTASAGFEDYLFDQKKLASELIHGRAGVDLQAMRGTGEKESDDEVRIDSLRAWDRQVIVCTVDTVLGLLQNQRRPLYSFPAIAAGAFVFDEIHSYDARLFGGLLRFLKTFPGLPVLLMSASIPPARLSALNDALGSRMGETIRGDKDIERYLRYCLHKRTDTESCQQDVIRALNANQKVLWVCNTVGEAIKLGREARVWAGIEPIIYHSRFRYRDRVKRQKQLIERFKADGPVLAITTQVCEMSLDISAHLMVTAECPLPSLVQRLGRLNRYATKDDPWPCLVYPFKGMPYNEDPAFVETRGDCIASMKACRTVVTEFDARACSQRDLADRLEKMNEAEQFEDYSAWLDDGWVTEPAQVREGDASITLIREEDLPEVEKEVGPRKKWTHGKLVPWTIPMLYRRDFVPKGPAGGYPVAPTGTASYSEKEGATWANEKQ